MPNKDTSPNYGKKRPGESRIDLWPAKDGNLKTAADIVAGRMQPTEEQEENKFLNQTQDHKPPVADNNQ